MRKIHSSLCSILFIAVTTLFLQVGFAQTPVNGDYRTGQAAVTWATAANWQIWNGTTWATASSAPGSSANVYIQAGHTVTLGADAVCNNLMISTGTTNATTGGDGLVALGDFVLTINGKLASYFGAVSTTLNTTNLAVTVSTTIPASPITKTANSATGRIKFAGSTRTIIAATDWGAGNTGATTTYDVEIAMTAGQTATVATSLKAYNFFITSGELNAGANRMSPDNGTTGQGNFTISSGATFISSASGTGTNAIIGRGAASAAGTFTNNGTLKLSGASPTIAMATVTNASGSTVEYTASGNQTFLALTNSGAAMSTYHHLTTSGSGTKTLVASLALVVNGNISITGASTLADAGNQITGTSGMTMGVASGCGYTTTRTTTPWWPLNLAIGNLTLDNNSTVSYNGTGTYALNTTNLFPTTYGNLSFTAGTSRTLPASTNILVNKDLTISAGTLADNGNTIRVLGNITNSATHSGAGKIYLNGSLLQTLTGAGTYGNLEIDNSSNGSLASSSTTYTINGVLTLTSGNLQLNTNILTFATGSSVSLTGSITGSSSARININGTGAFGTLKFTAGSELLNILSMNRSFTLGSNLNVTSTLIMSAGNIDATGYTLSLGTSPSTNGTLTWTSGFIIAGNFARYIPTTGITLGTSTTSRFPFGTAAGDDRSLYYGQTSATTGGLITASHTTGTGFTVLGTPFADNGTMVTSVSNAFWTVSTSSLATTTGQLRLQANGSALGTPLANVAAATAQRLTRSATIVQNSGTGDTGGGTTTAPYVDKTGMPNSELTGNFYVGKGTTITSIVTGNWGDATTWDCTCIPGTGDNVIIATGHNVTLGTSTGNNPPYYANDLTISATTSTLTASGTSNVLNINGNVSNTGTFLMSGADINVGPTGGGKKSFTNNANGILTINNANSTLTVNGNVLLSGSSTFNMSAGDFIVDGNDGTAGGSVASGTMIFDVLTATGTVNGGTITIVDPHYANLSSNMSFRYNVTSTGEDWTGNTLVFGGSSGTHLGANTFGFVADTYFSTGRMVLGNVTVNGGNTIANRFVSTNPSCTNCAIDIGGNLVINSNSEIRAVSGGSPMSVGTDLTNNGTLTIETTLGLRQTASAATNNAQVISGAGIFRNSSTSPTANFTNLTINNTNASGVTFSSSQSCSGTGTGTVSGTLTMTAGNVNLNSNTFTLGTTNTSAGTLSWTAGRFYNGTLTRWFTTSSMPTAYNINTGGFPMMANSNDRSVFLIRTASAFTTGGYISVSPTHTAGTTTITTPFTDGGQSINLRYNSSWDITQGGGWNLGAQTISMRVQGDGIGTVIDYTKLRVVADQAAAGGVAGTNTGSNAAPQVIRTTMGITDVGNTTNTFYIGYPATVTSIVTGNWGDATTWDCNCIPQASDNVIIAAGHNVTLGTSTGNNPPYYSADLTINASNSTLTASGANTLNVGGKITNSGTISSSGGSIINVTGGSTTGITNNSGATITIADATINIGPSGGGNRTLTNSGTLTLNNASSSLTVNGNVAFAANSTFNMSNGNFYIDGNDGTSGGSVATATNIFEILSPTGTVNGGTITLVDPHFNGAGVTFRYNYAISGTTLWTGNTLVVGGSSGTNSSTATNGFNLNTFSSSGHLILGNVTIDGGSGTSRFASAPTGPASAIEITNLTINANSELRTLASGGTISVGGNLVNNGTLTIGTTLGFRQSSAAATSLAQNVSGNGIFQNATTGATANYASMIVNNSNASGVTFSSSQSCSGVGTGTVSGTLTMTDGDINLNGNTFTLGISGATNGTLTYTAGNFFSGGTFTRWFSQIALPTSLPSSPTFPMKANGNDRSVYFADGGATYSGSGGTISVTANHVAGTTGPFTEFTDGQNINTQYNSNWVISTTLSGGGSTSIMRLQADGIGTVSDFTALRLIRNQQVALGTSGAGTGSNANPQVNKTGLTITDIQNTFYVGYPTCLQPTALTATNITTTDADLNWTPSGSETQWEIEWMLFSATPTGTPNVTGITSRPYPLGGLSADNTYKYYVRASCGGGGVSIWAGPFSFSTPITNDECSGAIDIGTLATGGGCTNTTVNTTGATQSSTGCAGTADDDVWYRFTVPVGYEAVNFSNTTISGNADRVLQFYSGSCGSLTSLLCSDPESGQLSGLTGGTTYYVRAYSWAASGNSTFTLCLSLPPANDICSGAINIGTIATGGGCTNTTINTATASQSQTGCTGTADDDVWYTFTLPVGYTALNYSNTNISGNTDRVIQIFSGSCGSLTSVACQDAESGQVSGLTGGTTYYLRAHTFGSGNSSNFTLCLSLPPANDICSGAINIGTIATGGGCTNTTINTATASQSSAACTGSGADDDVWYTFTLPAGYTALNYSNTNISGNSDRVLQIYSGTCGSLTSVACVDPESGQITGLTGGTTYYLRVHTYLTGNSTNFTLCLSLPPANDNCTGAVAIGTIPSDGTCVNTTINTATASQSSAACTGTADDDVWYSFVVPNGNTAINFTNTNISGNTDRVLQFYSGTCGSLTSILCSDPESGQLTGLTGGSTYYLRAHTYGSGNSTNFNLCLSLPAAPPANNTCATATTLTPFNSSTCGGATSGTLVGATNDGGANCSSGGATSGDVWYNFVATSTTHTITVVPNASLDAVFEVYANGSTCGSLVSSNCVDGPGAGGTETANINGFTVGNTYYVRVMDYNSSSTTPTFTICVTSLDPCFNVTTLTSGVPATVTLSGTGFWGNSTTLGCSSYLTPGKEALYQFTPSTTGWYTVRTNNVTNNPFVYYMYKPVSAGCNSGGWTCIGTSNDATPSININEIYLTGGVAYYILLDNSTTISTTHTFQIAPSIPAVMPTGTLFPSDGLSTIGIPTNGWNISGVNPDASFEDLSFNSEGDFLMLHFDSEPYKFTYYLQGSTANVGTLKIQESTDGTTWTDLATYTTNAPTSWTLYEHLLNTSSRFVRILKQTHNSNAYIDEVAVTKKIDLSCTTAPVSFFDKGGSGANYGNAEYNVWTIIPQGTTGNNSNVQFSNFNLENGFDYLSIRNGNSVGSPLLSSNNTGTTNPAQQTSSASDGSLTIYMYSDYSTTAAGWTGTLNIVNNGTRTWTGNTNTDWGTAGNWCGGGVPTGTTNVDIPDVTNDPVVAGTTATCNNITLQTGASLGVPSSAAITVNGAFTNNGTVNVANNGNFIQTTGSTLSGSGTFNVTRNGTSSSSVYNYWSTPIASASLGLLGGTNYLYNPANGTADFSDDNPGPDPGWAAASGSFSVGKGYAGQGPNPSVTFTGTANNGTVNQGVQYFTLVNGSTSPGVPYNLIGNPYPSNIDAASFLTANNTKVTGAIYYWDDDNTGGTGYAANDYAIWNGTGSTGGGGRTPNGMIATAQGFFVQTLSGATSVSFTNAMRAATATTFFKTEEVIPQRLWLRADNGTHTNQILVGYVEGATEDMDWFYDAQKLRGNHSVSFYSLLNDTILLGIQGLTPLNGADPSPVPLGLYAGATGQYSIYIDSIENFPSNMPINLLDADLGIIYDLRNGPYQFQTTQGEDNDRFILFPNEIVTALDEQENIRLNVYPNPNNGTFTVMLNSGIEHQVKISLFDITGKLVLAADKAISSGNNFITLENQIAGVYLLKVETADKTYNKRVVIY
ncbi:MAG: hypothetical protein POELPBGB_03068 [Bacteroidia bacterium]|nr:hypothetical protein [Bacteroidia bacterium]